MKFWNSKGEDDMPSLSEATRSLQIVTSNLRTTSMLLSITLDDLSKFKDSSDGSDSTDK
jgi:hypothetical protein